MSLKVFQRIIKSSPRGVTLHRPAINIVNQDVCYCTTSHTEDSERKHTSFAEVLLSKTKLIKEVFRTHEGDPAKHGMKHEGLYYTIDKASFDKLTYDLTYKDLRIQARTFQEACVMVRRPALEIIHAMKHMNYYLPIPKFVLYGDLGCGKNMTLLHVMHYCLNNDWCIIQTPWPLHWIEWYSEVAMSTHKPGRIDLPREAKAFLEKFLKLNGRLLDDHVTQFRYEWTKRETTEIGTPLKTLIKFGLQRVKFADDVVGALLKEIKQLASQKKLKVLVVIDGLNGFFKDTQMRIAKKEFKDSSQRQKKQEFIKTTDLTLMENIKKLLQPDMVNSICVSTVDYNLNPKEDRRINTPHYLLGKEGFEFMDPFIPINVPDYSDKEAYSCVEYFINRRWILNPKGHTEWGKKQLLFLSNKNPKTLYNVCGAW